MSEKYSHIKIHSYLKPALLIVVGWFVWMLGIQLLCTGETPKTELCEGCIATGYACANLNLYTLILAAFVALFAEYSSAAKWQPAFKYTFIIMTVLGGYYAYWDYASLIIF